MNFVYRISLQNNKQTLVPANITDMIGSCTLYKANPIVINPLVGRRRAAAVADLEEVVRAQLAYAEADGTFKCEANMNTFIKINKKISMFNDTEHHAMNA
jgi:hypothetical protein